MKYINLFEKNNRGKKFTIYKGKYKVLSADLHSFGVHQSTSDKHKKIAFYVYLKNVDILNDELLSEWESKNVHFHSSSAISNGDETKWNYITFSLDDLYNGFIFNFH